MSKPASPWRLDTSAGRSILVYEGCSVIEGEQAEYLLRLIVADAGAAQPARAGGDAPDWRELAARVMDALAENQDQINAQYPEHVKCYPSWEMHARWCRWHADMFRTGTPFGSGAGVPAVLAALAEAPQPAAVEAICIHGKGFQCVTCWPHPAAPSDAVGSSTKGGVA